MKPNLLRVTARKLMMLNTGYRKAYFLEQKFEKSNAALLAAIKSLKRDIEAVRPADRSRTVSIFL